MQNKEIPLRAQESVGSHVSFSQIEDHHLSADNHELSKINKNLEHELQLWNEMFVELTELLTKATTYPPIFIQNEQDKRNILKKLCIDVTNKALDPTSSNEYKILEENLTKCQNQVNELKIRCDEISENVGPIQKEDSNKEKNSLEQKIGNLETILKRQLKNRKDELNKQKNKSFKKRKSVEPHVFMNDSRRIPHTASFSDFSQSQFPGFNHRYSIPKITKFNLEPENSILNE